MSALRMFLGALAILLLVAALVSAACGAPGPAFGFGFWAVMLVVGVVFERWRYKPLADAPFGPGWSPTGERFVDTDTGKLVTVYFNAATGERRYVNH